MNTHQNAPVKYQVNYLQHRSATILSPVFNNF